LEPGELLPAELAAEILTEEAAATLVLSDELTWLRFHSLPPDQEPLALSYYLATSNIQADELTLLLMPDAAAAEAVLSTLTERVASQKAVFADYLPEQADLLDHAVSKVKGRYALLIVSPYAVEVAEKFDELVP
jgi:hypothetical protein